jgi:hypothetical protein
VIAQLREWVVQRDERNCPVGLCGTKHAAMDALSKALIAGGRPARGHIALATLVRPVHWDPLYVREAPERTAVYDGSVISWT